MSHEIEYTCIFPLMLSQGFVIHEQVYNVTITVNCVDPLAEFICGQRPFGPVAVRETKCDISQKVYLASPDKKVGGNSQSCWVQSERNTISSFLIPPLVNRPIRAERTERERGVNKRLESAHTYFSLKSK